jgi:hypothetical protein
LKIGDGHGRAMAIVIAKVVPFEVVRRQPSKDARQTAIAMHPIAGKIVTATKKPPPLARN